MKGSYRGKLLHLAVPFVIASVSMLLACFAFVSPRVTAASPPTTMNFQGRLADASGNIVANGSYNMQFKLYDASSGGTLLWSETRETTNRVVVTNGLFSTQLGQVTPLSASVFNNTNVYFEITMATPGTATCSTASCQSWESPMTSRQKLATSAYAFNSDTLDGLDSTAFAAASGSANYIQNGTSPQTADFNITGTGTANILQSTVLDRATAGTLTIGGTATSVSVLDDLNISSGKYAIANFRGVDTSTPTDCVYAVQMNAVVSCAITARRDASFLILNADNMISDSGNGSNQAFAAKTNGTTNAYILNNGTIVGTNIYSSSLDASTASTLTIGGTNATSISLADNTVLGAGYSLTLTGGNTASRPASPTEGMVYYDTDTKQLLTYSNGKWQSDSKTATFIVAASNSSQAAKDGAQYVANGEDSAGSGIGTLDGDQVQINNALTAASAAGGGLVYLAEGTYTLDAPISVPNNVTLAGAGNKSLVQLGNFGATSVTFKMITNTDTTTGTGITIRDLQLDGRRSINTSGNPSGVNFTGMGAGTGTTARQGATIQNITVVNMSNYAIYLDTSFNNKVLNNRLNSVGDGVYLECGSSYNLVSGNLTQGANGLGWGIYACSDYNTITSNTVESSNDFGILTNGSYNVISNNVVRDSGNGGIGDYGVEHNSITGNTVINNTWSGIEVWQSNYTVIANNTIRDSGGSTTNNGIELGSEANYANVTGNFIYDSSATTNNYAININNATADNVYLSNNTFNSGTINNIGTGTIFANQPKTAGGIDTLFKQAASTSAFQIQNASGTALLTADSSSTNNRIQIGSSTTDATAIFFMLDQYNNGTDPTGVNGAMYYNSNTGKFRCYQNGGWSDCITTDTIGANTTLSNLASTNINAALNTTAGNLTLQTTTSGNVVINAAGTTELQDDTNVGGNLTIAAGKSLTLNGGNTASRPGSPTDGMVYYDTDTKQLLVYNASTTKWQSDSKTAKFIVAASNSSQAVKDGAQYVANGEDSAGSGIGTLDGDQVQINDALTAASSAGGGIVFLAEGTYTVDAAISVPNNVILAGSGNNTLIQYGNFGSANLTLKMIVNSDTTTGTGVTIRDMRLDGRKSLNTVGTHDGVYLDGMGDSATARGGALVQNIKAENFKWTGVYLNNTDNTKVTDSTFTANANGVYALNSSYLTINDNIAYSNANSYRLFTTTDSTVGDNIANDGTGIGVYIANTSTRISVTGNIIKNNTGSYGVYTNLSSSILIANNTIESNDTGVLLDSSSNNTVQNNSLVSNTAYGVLAASAHNNMIQGNTMRNNGGATTNNAIDLYDADSNVITGNMITDSSATTNNYAIYIETAASDTNYLADNTIGTGSIQDLGTGTKYASQLNTAGQLISSASTVKATSTTAFQVQNTAGTAFLTVDTTNQQLVLRAASNTPTLGADLFTSAQFDAAASTNWGSISGTGPTATATHSAGATAALVLTAGTDIPATVGVTYEVEFDISGYSAGSVYAYMGGDSDLSRSANGTNIKAVLRAFNVSGVRFYPTSDFVGTISNVTVKAYTNLTPTLTLQDSAGSTAVEIRANSSTTDSLFMGLAAGIVNTGGQNTGYGAGAMRSNTTGTYNTALGQIALVSNVTGSENTVVGAQGMTNNVTGNSNTAVGMWTFDGLRSGSNNTSIGVYTGYSSGDSTANTYIGAYSGGTDSGTWGEFSNGYGLQNATAIGAYSLVQQSNSIVLGSINTTTLVGIGTTKPDGMFSVSPVIYSTTGTSVRGSQSASTTVTASSGSPFTSAMVGMKIIFSDGTSDIIQSYTSATQVVVSTSRTINNQHFRVHRAGFQVGTNGDVLVKNTSTAAFTIQNSAGTALLTADTTNNRITLGTSDTTGTLLVLDTKTDAADPTGVNGGMYYNSNKGKLRCYEGGAWVDCTNGYTVNVQALTSSPTDAQTVYFGNLPKAPVTTAATSKIYIRKTGVIKFAEIYTYSGTAGTNENWSLYVRVNNTTDTLIQTVGAATNERVFTNSSLSIAVNAGDYIEIKGVQPTWATNPLTTIYGGYLYIQ